MGAFKFVGRAGDPVNTLEPLDAKSGIFGGLVALRGHTWPKKNGRSHCWLRPERQTTRRD
jgi:hypothetical protein